MKFLCSACARDDICLSRTHLVYIWTFTGHDAGTGNPVNVSGWEDLEDWDLDKNLKMESSCGWFEPYDCARQVEG